MKKLGLFNIVFFIILLIVVALGIFIRIHAFLHTHNIFYDEAALLLNIKERTYSQLFLPLDYEQCCPPLFMILGKFIYTHFGLNLYAIKSIPFVFSLLSLILFTFLSLKMFRSRVAIIISNFMFAFSYWLLTYTMFFKHYISDACVSILILFVAYHYKDRILSKVDVSILAILAILCLLMSYTSVIILSSTFIVFVLYKYNKSERKEWLKKSLLFVLIYGIFSVVYYFVNMKSPANADVFQIGWGEFYPRTFENIVFTLNLLMGYILKPIAALVIMTIAGIFLVFKDRFSFGVLFLPFIVAFILAYFKKYPILPERVILYLIPIFLLLVNKSIDSILKIENKLIRNVFYYITILVFLCSLNILEIQQLVQNIKTKQYTNITDKVYWKKEKTSNAERALEWFKQYGITKDDYIIAKMADKLVFDLYDKDNLINTSNISYNNEFNIPIGSTIYAYVSEEYDEYEFFEADLKNCEILEKVEDGAYYFIKAKKIKDD